jgi:hypothetical protein
MKLASLIYCVNKKHGEKEVEVKMTRKTKT